MTQAELERFLEYIRDICSLLDQADLMIPSRSVDRYTAMRDESRQWRNWAYNERITNWPQAPDG